MKTETSQKLFAEAQKHLVGGVNSPVRAFKAVGGTPPFIVRAKGAYVTDADGNEYIDYVGSWGPAILGHAHPVILNALYEAMKNGLSFGAPTPKEIDLAKKIKDALPSIELIRFVSSGTEAVMSAIRVARGFTGRDKIVKFDGCYHGHADSLLVKAGSGAQTLGIPDSAGVPKSFAEHTLTACFNDLDSIEQLFTQNKNQIAALIAEPIMGNIGCIPPKPGFLKGLRELCDRYGTVLVFDEVITGFRVAYGGAQQLYDVRPDLTCLGKIIGGGLPVGAYGGRRDIMEKLSPLGPVYQAGTLSGNPLAMAVGAATLTLLKEERCYSELESKSAHLQKELEIVFKEADIPVALHRVGSMFSIFFSTKPPANADEARQNDACQFVKIFHRLLENRIYFAPSAFECAFISKAHSTNDFERTIEAFKKALITN